ncbi:MAG: hypothetical protein L0Z68_05830 [Gammaproteobacteria bacterium]|nr:hypothetical protein [Gammaproteobacteria bacterium]
MYRFLFVQSVTKLLLLTIQNSGRVVPLIAALLTLAGNTPPTQPAPSPYQMVFEDNASTVSKYLVDLLAGVAVTFETAALSPGSDPVVHLLEASFGNEVAVDDNGAGGKASRLVYKPAATGKYWLIVRGRTQASGGTCDLLKDGTVWQRAVPFAGRHLRLDNLRAQEQIITIRPPNGATIHNLYILKSDGLGIEKHGASEARTSFSSTVALGSRNVIIGVPQNFSPGKLQLLRNDVNLSGHDPDKDGLGTELETALGSCSSLSGIATGPDGSKFDCRKATDPRDTDGDGISDGWEVLGREYVYQTAPNVRKHEYLKLPLWGADPRHKDLFVEVDFMLRSPGESPQKLSPAVAKEFARYYQDQVGSLSAAQIASHAAVLRNPDGLPGINVHLDTGVPPNTPEDETLYGDWGGYTAVPPVKKPDGTWVGSDFTQAWKDYMSPARFGVFRYALPYASGGGSVPINSFAFAAGITSALVLAHESGHAMGLGHSGPPGATGVVDVNCKPNYPSIMNYAYDDGSVGFADGSGAPSLNNSSLNEWQAVPPNNTAYLDVLERVFKYWVDREHGHVDWDRNGFFAPAGATVRAYANFAPGGGGCEYTRYNATEVPNAASVQTPAMARLGDHLYVFYSVLGILKYAYSTSAWNCPVPDVTPCGTWAGTNEDAFMDAKGGVDAVRIGYGSSSQLLVVTIDRDGKLWQARLSLNAAGQAVWTTPSLIPDSSPAAGEPSLARIDGGAYLVYKGTDGKIRFNRMTAEHGWFGEQLALTPAGATISTVTYSSPAIERSYLPYKPGLPALYGAFADPSGKLDIWWFNNGAGRWEKTNVLETRPGPIEGRPAMVWVPYRTNTEYPGRFYLMYISYDTDQNRGFREKQRMVRMMMSYVKVTNTGGDGIQKIEMVGLDSPFDNVWMYAFGIDLLYESGIDKNLRAVLASAINKPESWTRILVRPKADGINNFTYTNYNDWEVLRIASHSGTSDVSHSYRADAPRLSDRLRKLRRCYEKS